MLLWLLSISYWKEIRTCNPADLGAKKMFRLNKLNTMSELYNDEAGRGLEFRHFSLYS